MLAAVTHPSSALNLGINEGKAKYNLYLYIMIRFVFELNQYCQNTTNQAALP